VQNGCATIAVAVNVRIGQNWLIPLAAALSKTWQYVCLPLRRSLCSRFAAQRRSDPGMVGAIAGFA
jgi:hypothetical protein